MLDIISTALFVLAGVSWFMSSVIEDNALSIRTKMITLLLKYGKRTHWDPPKPQHSAVRDLSLPTCPPENSTIDNISTIADSIRFNQLDILPGVENLHYSNHGNLGSILHMDDLQCTIHICVAITCILVPFFLINMSNRSSRHLTQHAHLADSEARDTFFISITTPFNTLATPFIPLPDNETTFKFLAIENITSFADDGSI